MLEWIGVALLSSILVLGSNGFNLGNIEATEDTTGTDTYVVEHKVQTETIKDVITLVGSNQNITVQGVDTEISMTPLGKFEATAYCPCALCCENWAGSPINKTTSIGVGAYQGNTIAVDPTQIPYGTKLYVDGVGTFIASDCGGAIKKNRLDIYFANHNQALNFGRKQVNVYKINE